MKLLLDTNIVVDLICKRHPYDGDARKLCIGTYFGDLQLWVNMQSYADAYYILCKDYTNDEIKKMLIGTLEFFKPLACHPLDLKPALLSDWQDVEDYLIAHSGKRASMDFFITRDEELLQKSPIPAMSAAEFLAFLKQEHGLVYEDIELEG